MDDNRLPLYVYGNPNNLVNNAPLNANSLRAAVWQVPGHGLGDAVRARPLRRDAALQRDAAAASRAGCRTGLQMGMAYTLAKGEGYTGYDPYTDEIGGEAAISARYWGPTTDDRRHNLVSQLQLRHPDVDQHAGGQAAAERLAGVGRHQAAERPGDHADLHVEQPRHQQHQPVADRIGHRRPTRAAS